MLASEVAVVKSHHGISVNWSQYRNTGPTDPSLENTELYSITSLQMFADSSTLLVSRVGSERQKYKYMNYFSRRDSVFTKFIICLKFVVFSR